MTAIKKGIINLLLTGFSGWDSNPIEKHLGVFPKEATPEDIKKLNKAQIVQLFHQAEAPEFSSMKGEYQAMLLDAGIFAFAANFYTHKVFGPGRWEGKAFFPFTANSGWGYNIFQVKNKKTGHHHARVCKMNTYHGVSNIDTKESFHLDYGPHNRFPNASMHDEIRKINDSLFLGMGYLGAALNPAPFLIYGKAKKWVGPDKS